jgi:hypothetical protein
MALDNALRVPTLLAMHTQTLNARIDSAATTQSAAFPAIF